MRGNGRVLGCWSFKSKCSRFHFSLLSGMTSSLDQVRFPNLNILCSILNVFSDQLLPLIIVLNLAPVVQRADNFIHWIGRYPADEMCARFSR